jgi:hypothetical protein
VFNKASSSTSISSLWEWLAGCTDIVAKAALGSGDVDSVELLNGINFNLAEKIVGKQTQPIFYPFY